MSTLEVARQPLPIRMKTKTERASLARDVGERLLRGPNRINDLGSKVVYYEPVLRLWTYREYHAPKIMATVFTVPFQLRPSTLLSIVRRCTYDFATFRLKAMREEVLDPSVFDVEFREIGRDAEDALDESLSSLIEIAHLPRAAERISPRSTWEEPSSDTYLGFEYSDSRGTRNLEWCVSEGSALDSAWRTVFDVTLRANEPLTGEFESWYAIDPWPSES